MTPDEEKNLNHYVQVLQKLVLSVPTKKSGHQKISKTPHSVHSVRPQASQLKELISPGKVSTENGILSYPFSNKATPLPTRDFQPAQVEERYTKSTPFWSIKPNNVSVVLRTKEPYIEKEEPEPELESELLPEPRTGAAMLWPNVTELPPSPSSRSTYWETSTEIEDVPQLSGEYDTALFENNPLIVSKEILDKISNLRSEVQHVPLTESLRPEYRKDIQASREHLRRSLAIAEAAEHRLQKMYKSQGLPLERSGFRMDDMETVITMLYNSRSKLSQYLNIKYVPLNMRQKAAIVVLTLKRTLCISRPQTQSLIRRLLNNNIKILNILDIP